MASPSLGDRVIGWYGDVAARNLEQHPGFVRGWLMTGFRAMQAKTDHVPDRTLLPSGNEGYALFMDSVVDALGDVDREVITSVFVPNEMFHAMGLLPVTAEAVASFASGAQAEGAFIANAEGRGIPETYCSYHRILMGMALSGVLRSPRLLASCTVACDANNLTFKALAKHWGVPHYYVDVPEDVSAESIAYVADQLRQLGALAEGTYGKTLDSDALVQACQRSQHTMRLLAQTLPARRGRYLANTMTIELMQMLDFHLSLGTPRCQQLAQHMLRDFGNAKRFDGLNLVWAHVSPYFLATIGDQINAVPTAQIVASDMMFDAVDVATQPLYGPQTPYEFMAERLVRNCFNGPSTRRAQRLLELAQQTDAQGVVLFCHWGCKQTAGAAQIIRTTLEDAGYPTLVLDGDACDRQNCMPGQLGTRMSAFLELLQNQKEGADGPSEH